jgi:hypothetical protein
MRLIEPFYYFDSAGEKWKVPAGAVVDGASIPRIFWSFIGHPFRIPYRNASVIHDYYCDVRLRPWRRVHRTFHEAMLTSGVSETMANVMYFAVYAAGPRWNQQAVESNRSLRSKFNETYNRAVMACRDQGGSEDDCHFDMRPPKFQPELLRPPISDVKQLLRIADQVRAKALTQSDIDRLVDGYADHRPGASPDLNAGEE